MGTDKQIKDSFEFIIDNKIDNNFMELRFLADEHDEDNSVRQAELIEEEALKIFKKNPDKKYNTLVNLTPLGRVSYLPGKARDIYKRITAHPQVGKVALVGGDIFIQIIVNFIMQVSGKKEAIKEFASLEEARAWLKK